MASTPKWKAQQLWKNKYKKPSGSSWVDPGNPFGVGKPGGPPALPPNAAETIANSGMEKDVIVDKMKPPPPPPRTYDLSPDKAFITGEQGANTAYNNAMASIAAQRTIAAEEFGIDPNTGTFAENVDVTNPYSRAALLNKSYAQNQKMTYGGFANRGALTSGAYAAALQSQADDYNQSRKGLEQAFAAKRADFLNAENQAQADKLASLASLQGDLVNRRMAEDAPTFGEEDVPTSPAAEPKSIADLLTLMNGTPPKPKKPKKKPKNKRK